MIRGILFNPRSPSGHASPVALPLIGATLYIPRLAVSRTFYLLVDTGADITSLHLRDAVKMLGVSKFRQLRGRAEVSGIAGTEEYFLEPAHIVFVHEDGKPEGLAFDLRIAKLSAKSPAELAHKLRLPSVLGRDILYHFRMVMDCSSNEFYLEHP